MSESSVLVSYERELSLLEKACAHFSEECFQTATALGAALAPFVNRMARPTGIFIGTDERCATYRDVCRLMLAIEPYLADFRVALASDHTQRRLSELQCRMAAFAGQSEGILPIEPLDALEKRLQYLVQTYEQETASWRNFYTNVLSDFVLRVEVAADFCHEGQGCDPHAVIALCGAVSASLKNVLRKPSV